MALATKHLSSYRSSFFQGSPSLFSERSPSSPSFKVNRGGVHVTCKKKDIHPKYYHQAKVYCNGEEVMVTGGTQPNYVVDIWSGNHPFYQGNKAPVVVNDRVEQFKRRYGVSKLSEVPVLTKGEIIWDKKNPYSKKKK